MPASPSTLNYFEGKGVASFKAEGEMTYRDLGNAPSFQLSPAIETRSHFSSRTGTRTEDRRDTVSRTLNVSLTLDEITLDNLALFFSGLIDTATDGTRSMEVFSTQQIRGAFRLVGTNDIGNKFTIDIPSAALVPEGEFDFIGEDYGTLVLSGLAEAVDGIPATITETAVASA